MLYGRSIPSKPVDWPFSQSVSIFYPRADAVAGCGHSARNTYIMSDFQSTFLHCRIRVGDLDRSVKFYTEVFGFQELRRFTSPAGNQLCFLELPGSATKLELAFSPDFGEIQFPEDIFHFAFDVADLDEFRKKWEPRGIEFWPDDGPVNGHFYFIDDPDGYEIEVTKA